MTFYTIHHIRELLRIYTEYSDAENRLHAYCKRVAQALDFDDALFCGLHNDKEIIFTAEWTGPYQSRDTKLIAFPLAGLLHPPEVTAAEVKKVITAEQAERDREKLAEREAEERQVLEKLKQKYEGKP